MSSIDRIPSRSPESHAEKIHTKTEILSFIIPKLEGPHTIVRELSDDKGLFLLEVRMPGTVPGEVIEYDYTRKGHHQGNAPIQASESTIDSNYYQDGEPIGGTTFARFDYENNSWRKL